MENSLDYEILSVGHTFYKNGIKLFTYYLEYLKLIGNTPAFVELNQKNYLEVLRRQTYAVNRLYVDALEAYNTGSEAFPYEYDSRIHVTMNQDNIFSGYLEEYIFTGGAHGNTMRIAFTYDSHTLEARTLCSFMKEENCLPCISEHIIQQINNSGHIDDYFPEYQSLVTQNLNAENFYIAPEGVIVYFDLYSIAPYVSGIKEYIIPMNSC